MPEHFIIRKGQQHDLAELQKLYVETITTICYADYDKQQIEAWISGVENLQRWNTILTKQIILVAQYADKIVGFATLDRGHYIDLFYVHKDYQRQGIANKLYMNIENIAKQQKQTELISDVSKTARPFFENKGFSVQKEQHVYVKGVELTNYKMIKAI
ncbi:GNAT family N-acetyltransferase [Pedobacter montanisoli]|uniref:GNAT family N-acetyltransferase n=1 Tax=Pedobacter montanisoli TaxID=2923277 RepID=A0ABS9ZZ39_9SPHI|nr:GNAT family N-acetyltransferase [Pedobacter montanisoli]MCJ0743589.1 GNAT family N-acetyltransferase [Pedobacter montanisoli]